MKEPSIAIRNYDMNNENDLTSVTEIYKYHVLHGRASFEHDPPDEDEMRERFRPLLANSYPIFVAEMDGDIIGYAYAGPHKARKGYNGTVEDSIYVAPSSQRCGVGRSLLSTLITAATDAGYSQMMAVIGDSKNIASIRMHETLGFTMIGTARDIGYKFGNYLDVVYMQKKLANIPNLKCC